MKSGRTVDFEICENVSKVWYTVIRDWNSDKTQDLLSDLQRN